MALVIRAIKEAYRRKIQKGRRLQIPLTIWNPSKLCEGMHYEMISVTKGDVISDSGIFIKFFEPGEIEVNV